MDHKKIVGYATIILGIVIFFSVIAQLVPTAMDAGDQLNTSEQCLSQGGYFNHTDTSCDVSASDPTAYEYNTTPLSALFSGGGIVFIVIMASVIMVVIAYAWKTK
ncbi:MAG: hypothetical protein GF315_09810 [candidate division Zixibacteria bacterium]|nr:hypothetical protein [candidate division Zixibacteria bacterium]